jgi:uroporphyrinogen decarboxylase
MTGKERILKVLNHQEPDRVPYDLAGTTVTSITKGAYQNAMKHKGLPTDYDHEEIDPISQIVTPIEENLVKLRSDTRRVGAQRIPEYHERKVITDGVVEVTDFYGCKWQMDPEKHLYFNQATYPLKDFDSLSEGIPHLPRPDLDDYFRILRKDLAEQVKNVGTCCGIADRNTAGFTENSLRIRGYEEWYMDNLVDYDGVDRLIQIILEDKLEYWDAVIDWLEENQEQDQIDVISECDDLGSQRSTILEPEQLRKLVIPRMATLFGHIKKRMPHVRIFFHCCGSIRPIIPDMIEAGVDILNPVQYKALDMELGGLKRDFGKDLTFWGGGIDTQSILNSKDPEKVRDEVKRTLDILAPGGGFVFAPVHNIQDDVSPENFWAMWETLQEYGKY